MIELVPVTLQEAKRFVSAHHRHNRPPVSWKVGVGLARDGELVGVGILSRPVSPKVQATEPRTIEIVRVCTLGDKNANSRLYGALCRAAAALGYTSAITYTLESEGGASLRASGFVCEGIAGGRPGQTWNVPSRARVEANLFGEETIPSDEPKLRWRRVLGREVAVESRATLAVEDGGDSVQLASAVVDRPAQAKPYPKPARRIVDPQATTRKVLADPVCRACGARAETGHHLIPKGERGDDVEANIVPVCGDGARGCHGALHGSPYVAVLATVPSAVEGFDHATRTQRRDGAWVRRRIGERLRADELDYVLSKLGPEPGRAYLERHYYAELAEVA